MTFSLFYVFRYHEIAWYNRNGFCHHPPRNMADALYNYGRFIQMVWRGASRIGVGNTTHYLVARYSSLSVKGSEYLTLKDNVWC